MPRNKDKRDATEPGGTAFAEEWTLSAALAVLHHPTVDSRLWAEAVEWLLMNGPEDVREELLAASAYATAAAFPQLKARGCAADGQPCYSIAELASALEADTREVEKVLREKERSHGRRHGFAASETTNVQ